MQVQMGRYVLRVAAGPQDLTRALALRAKCFEAAGADGFDARCTHVLIEMAEGGALVCCFRILPLAAGDIAQSYSARFYNLTALAQFGGPVLEIGRFCTDPDHPDPDILRLAWAFLTRWVDAHQVGLLFGCASFKGCDASLHLDAFAQLFARHQAPPRWQPRAKAPEVFDFANGLAGHRADSRRGAAGIPPLLRSYLLMGGWVSDHAVFDRALGTMHVFTGVEIAAVPESRARLLRALADAMG